MELRDLREIHAERSHRFQRRVDDDFLLGSERCCKSCLQINGELSFEVTRTRLIRSSQIAQHYFHAPVGTLRKPQQRLQHRVACSPPQIPERNWGPCRRTTRLCEPSIFIFRFWPRVAGRNAGRLHTAHQDRPDRDRAQANHFRHYLQRTVSWTAASFYGRAAGHD